MKYIRIIKVCTDLNTIQVKVSFVVSGTQGWTLAIMGVNIVDLISAKSRDKVSKHANLLVTLV